MDRTVSALYARVSSDGQARGNTVLHESDWSAADRVEWDDTGEAASDLEDRVAETRAATIAGVRAKAAVLNHMAEAYGIPCPEECAASLVADLVALGGAA